MRLHRDERAERAGVERERRVEVGRELVGCAHQRQVSWRPPGSGGHDDVVESLADDDTDLLCLLGRRRSVKECREPSPALRGQQPNVAGRPCLPLGVGHERHEVWLGEVPIVEGLFFRPERHGTTRALVPMARLLDDDPCGLEQCHLPCSLILDGTAE